jgi:hypothetical protein
MDEDRENLGQRISVHGANRGIGGLENRGVWVSRWIWVPLTGLLFAIPGLVISALVQADVVILIAAAIGAIVGYSLAPRLLTLTTVGGAAVTQAELFSQGLILTDGRGRHEVRWNQVAEVAGRQTEHRLNGVTVRVSYQFRVRTASEGYWLDERLEDVSNLASQVAAAAGLTITPLPI